MPFTGNVTVPNGSIVTLYISGYDAKNSGSSMQADNVVVTGTVPEPQIVLLIALALPALFFLRKSRQPAGLPSKR